METRRSEPLGRNTDVLSEPKVTPVGRDDIYRGSMESAAPPGSIELLSPRQSANGTGLPPFNSTGLPPVNLAFMDACNTGLTNTYGEGILYPFGNYYTGTSSFPEDQCQVGYGMEFNMAFTRTCADAFYGILADGWTVTEARQESWAAYQSPNQPPNADEYLRI